MALNSINTNVAAMAAQSNINRASTNAGLSIARLSSGNRLVRAMDDVAALSVGTSLRTQVTTLRMALVNTTQGSSLLQVADGALTKIQDILQRQKALAVQASSGSLTDTERSFLNTEFQGLVDEIDRLVASTNFNGVKLLGGLGTNTQLAQTNTTAAGYDPTNAANTNFSDASTYAIMAFDITSGGELAGSAAAGEMDIVDSSNTVLSNGAYNNVSGAVYGQFEKFEITNVDYGVSATLTATLNGVEFVGTFAHNATTVRLENGSTRLQLNVTALNLTSDATTQIAQAQIHEDFRNTSIMRTNQVLGVNFEGTSLEGVIGANGGIAMVRMATSGTIDIGNFQYVGNDGAADTNLITVEINGRTFTAAAVTDAIAAGDTIVFEGGNGEGLYIDFTGLNTGVTNIRTDVAEREAFINALNVAFSRAGAGLDFAVGTESDDSIRIALSNVSTQILYEGAALDIGTAQGAEDASIILDRAIDMVTAVRADVGAYQSRFDFAAANVETSITNQDAARGSLMDTDIAAESTAFATAQVQVQAGISVLAQANLLPQNLLKLIG